jgi:hypothetical protein
MLDTPPRQCQLYVNGVGEPHVLRAGPIVFAPNQTEIGTMEISLLTSASSFAAPYVSLVETAW